MNSRPHPSAENSYLSTHIKLLLASYQHWCKIDLIKTGSVEQDAKTIFHAPFAVLSHNAATDPIFTYANQTAMHLFGMDWQEFMTTPSRYSAEPVNRAEREKMLNDVNNKGYTDQYSGVRITKQGLRFRIHKATVWNLIDKSGIYLGQAAMFSNWSWIQESAK